MMSKAKATCHGDFGILGNVSIGISRYRLLVVIHFHPSYLQPTALVDSSFSTLIAVVNKNGPFIFYFPCHKLYKFWLYREMLRVCDRVPLSP